MDTVSTYICQFGKVQYEAHSIAVDRSMINPYWILSGKLARANFCPLQLSSLARAGKLECREVEAYSEQLLCNHVRWWEIERMQLQ